MKYPSDVGFYSTPSSARGTAASGGYVYVAQTASGLGVYQYTVSSIEEASSAQVRMATSGPTVLSGASGVKRLASCVVFDAMGRRVVNPRSGVLFVMDEGRGAGDEGRTRKVVIQN